MAHQHKIGYSVPYVVKIKLKAVNNKLLQRP